MNTTVTTNGEAEQRAEFSTRGRWSTLLRRASCYPPTLQRGCLAVSCSETLLRLGLLTITQPRSLLFTEQVGFRVAATTVPSGRCMMDQQRGRSPSAGQQHPHISQSHSPTGQQYHENVSPGNMPQGLDPNLVNNGQSYSNSILQPNLGLQNYGLDPYMAHNPSPQYPQATMGGSPYLQSEDYGMQYKPEDMPQSQMPLSNYGNQQDPQTFSSDMLNPSMSGYSGGDFSLYSPSGMSSDNFDASFFLNDSMSQGQLINPADIMSDMSSPMNDMSTPPQMMHGDSMQGLPLQHGQSPGQQQYSRTPSHSRNTSLAPESAAFPQGQMPAEWNIMQPQFTTHRRTPSEFSEISVPSAAPSPSLLHQDTFDPIDQNYSPMLRPQDPALYQEVLGLNNFTLSDTQSNRSRSNSNFLASPARSPVMSPNLLPQQMPHPSQQNGFMMGMNGAVNNGGFGVAGPDMYGGNESFPQLQHHNSSGEMGQAQQMIPPDINIEFAPASRQNSFEPPKPTLDQDALTPPERRRHPTSQT